MPKRTVQKTSELNKNVGKKKTCKVLFVSSEAYPFFGTGGLGEYSYHLPRALNDSDDCDVRVILPLYEDFPQERRKDLEFVCWTFVKLAWRNQYCGLFRIRDGNNVIYFIDNEYYFKRKNLYGYQDDGERFAYFSKAVLDILPRLDFKPNIIHCNDWQTALIPAYRKLYYVGNKEYSDIRIVFTIHNIIYQGWYDRGMAGDVFGISENDIELFEQYGEINLLKGAIYSADVIATVSPTYAREIMMSERAYGLDVDIRKNRDKLYGILNGIDETVYDPRSDKSLAAQYSSENTDAKVYNKLELQKSMWLPVNKDIPTVGILCPSYSNQATEFIRSVVSDLVKRNIQIIFIAFGGAINGGFLQALQDDYDDKVRVTALGEVSLRKQCAGLDMIVIPDEYTPCGTVQMIACKYGAIPIVRASGGLNDTVIDFAEQTNIGNGFKFDDYDAKELVRTVDRAIEVYLNENEDWKKLVKRAMLTRFSWINCAEKYIEMYRAK